MLFLSFFINFRFTDIYIKKKRAPCHQTVILIAKETRRKLILFKINVVKSVFQSDRSRQSYHNRIPSRFLSASSLTHRLHTGAHIRQYAWKTSVRRVWNARMIDHMSLLDHSHVSLSLRRANSNASLVSCNELEQVPYLSFFHSQVHPSD